MADVTRYHLEDSYYGEIEPEKGNIDPQFGEWCRYSDVAPVLERCRELEAERDLLIRNWVPKNLWPLHLRTDLAPEVRAALSGDSPNA